MLKSSILTKLDASSSKKGSLLIPPSTPTPTPTPQQKSPTSEKQNKTYMNQSNTPIDATILRKDEQMRLAAERDNREQKTATQADNNASSGSTRNTYYPVTSLPSKLDFINYLVAAMTEDKKSSTSSYSTNKSNTSKSSSSGGTSKNSTSQFAVPDKLDLFNNVVAALMVNKTNDSSYHGAGIANSHRSTSGNSFTPPKNQQVGTMSEQGIPEDYAELAGIVAELPNDFDLKNWDDKTAIQQHKALTNSGLSGEDQMKLLNSPTSIETLAKIQDIQANRIEYGLTQAKANQISAGLLEIANARIGVKNREIPFTTSSQRNIFLAQLDKEEQKLLESVNGHNVLGTDILRGGESQKPKNTQPPEIINNVKDNKLARAAKDILKFYMNGYIIYPLDNILFGTEYWGKYIDGGTISVGVSASGFAIVGLSGNIGLAMDKQGDVGVAISKGFGGGTPSFSVVGFLSVTNAADLLDLKGESAELGGSIGSDPSMGIEVFKFSNESGREYIGFNLLGGAGYAFSGKEVHDGMMETSVMPLFNLYDKWKSFLKEYKAW